MNHLKNVLSGSFYANHLLLNKELIQMITCKVHFSMFYNKFCV